MSRVEAPFHSAYPDGFIDSLADLTASILRESLAPILQTLKEHGELIDVHTALLNHSTVMNHYNVGKIEDIRDFQNNINFKLQRFVLPENRCYPKYQTHPNPTAGSRTETVSNVESSLPRDKSDATDPSATERNDAETPERPPASPVTERADSRPNTPRQQQGDGFGVVPGPSRRLQRERPFSVEADPMWNSHREINPYMRLALPAPPPPYIPPPAYTDEGSVPRVEPQPSSSSQTIRRTSLALAPPVPPPSASEEEAEEEEVDATLSSRAAGERRRTIAANSPPLSSSPLSNGTVIVASGDAEKGDAEPPTQLSEKARGKKRMREEDYETDDDDNALAEGSGSRVQGDDGDDPRGEGSSSRGPISGGRRNRNRKRQKREDVAPIHFNLDPVEIDDHVVSTYVAFGGTCPLPPNTVRRRYAEKLKAMQKLFCGGRDLH